MHSGHDAPASGRLCDGEWPVAVALWNGAAVRLDQSFLTEGRNFSFPSTQTHQECHARRHPAQGNASQRQRGLARLFRVPRWRRLALGSSRGKRQVRCVARRKEKFGLEGGGHPFSPPGRRLLSLIEGWPLYSALVSTGWRTMSTGWRTGVHSLALYASSRRSRARTTPWAPQLQLQPLVLLQRLLELLLLRQKFLARRAVRGRLLHKRLPTREVGATEALEAERKACEWSAERLVKAGPAPPDYPSLVPASPAPACRRPPCAWRPQVRPAAGQSARS